MCTTFFASASLPAVPPGLEELLVFPLSINVGGAARHNLIVASQRLQIESRILLHQVYMGRRFRSAYQNNAAAEAQDSLYVFLKTPITASPPVVKIVRRATMEVSDARTAAGRNRRVRSGYRSRRCRGANFGSTMSAGNLAVGAMRFNTGAASFEQRAWARTIPQALRFRQEFKYRFKYRQLGLERKQPSASLIQLFRAPLEDEFRDIDAGRTNRAAGLTVQTGLHHPLPIQIGSNPWP